MGFSLVFFNEELSTPFYVGFNVVELEGLTWVRGFGSVCVCKWIGIVRWFVVGGGGVIRGFFSCIILT